MADVRSELNWRDAALKFSPKTQSATLRLSPKNVKNLWFLPGFIKESVDLPDLRKDSVPILQILCTFQATHDYSKCTVTTNL